ncbi:MAG: acylphosphatase [Thaumarchaeota archaeon]|jgi:acylphosphatase|nr:acylphosphatase [Nitrososphaerota archaeon]
MVRAHVHVSGRVQGVFFRYETKSLADELGVKGWVRNLPDGRVEAVFEGEETLVRRMIDFCRKGPPGARVTGVEIEWEEYKGEFKGFAIRR